MGTAAAASHEDVCDERGASRSLACSQICGHRLADGLLGALGLGLFAIYESNESESLRFAPYIGSLIGFAIGHAVGETDVWYSPDWFPPMSWYLRKAIMLPFVLLGGCLGVLVEAIWGAGTR